MIEKDTVEAKSPQATKVLPAAMTALATGLVGAKHRTSSIPLNTKSVGRRRTVTRSSSSSVAWDEVWVVVPK